MNQFLAVFEFIDTSVFSTINSIKNFLDIACKGQYHLEIAFNNQESKVAEQYKLLGAPALINLKTKQIIYGDLSERDLLKEVMN